jgi:hypothetical protein
VFEFKDVLQVTLMRPDDWSLPHGAMLVHTSDDVFMLAVPQKVSLDTAANVLHRLGVKVLLKGWEPSETDTRVQVKDEVAIRPPASKVATGTARIWDVPAEDGPLMSSGATAWSLVAGLTPAVIGLLLAIGAVIYVIVKWSALTIVERSALIGGALVAVIAGLAYLILIGQFVANRILIAAGRKALQTRGHALFADDEELIPVDVFDRTAWTSSLAREVDCGFLQIDRTRGALKFEGKKQRWEIPVTALSACRIEEARVGSEANENAEKRYFVVIASARDGEPWEAGMTPTRTALGSDGSTQRYERAQGLLKTIGAAVSA